MASLRLKGNAFAEPDYFRTDVTKGVTRTPAGTRICTLPSDFLLGFRDAVIYECGRSYRGVMKAAGKKWGTQFIKRLDREMTTRYAGAFRDLPEGLVRVCLVEAFNAHGYGALSIEDSAQEVGWLEVTVTDPMMPSLVRESERPVDLLTAGLLGAVFSHLEGETLDAVQTECPSLGADASRFLVGPAIRVAEVEQWLEDCDPFPSHEAIAIKLFHAVPHDADTALELPELAAV